MSRFAEMRARHALDAAGLDPSVPLEPANSVTNEVWIGHELIVRVNSQANDRLRREAALAVHLPSEVGYPNIVAYGGEVGADFLILERLPGHPLGRWWPGMSTEQRHAAITQLARRLKAVHRTKAPNLPPLTHTPQLLQRAQRGRDAVQPLLGAVDRLHTLEFVDSPFIQALERRIQADAEYLTPFDVPTLIHGDLTFENILWDGQSVTGILDFEWARPGPPDLDLDIFLRCCAYPHLHAAPDYEDRARAMDYREVPWWMADEYPELFDAPFVTERVRVYGFAWDVAELLAYPPRVAPNQLPIEHPYHRLRQAIDGSSYLDALSGELAIPG